MVVDGAACVGRLRQSCRPANAFSILPDMDQELGLNWPRGLFRVQALVVPAGGRLGDAVHRESLAESATVMWIAPAFCWGLATVLGLLLELWNLTGLDNASCNLPDIGGDRYRRPHSRDCDLAVRWPQERNTRREAVVLRASALAPPEPRRCL
jgi:hypothetical protein